MPIEGLSNQVRLTRAGIIRLGIKKASKKSGKEYPAEVDYFVCPDEVKKIYGEKPKKLLIMFPVESDLEFFSQWYKAYGNGILLCKGDGIKAKYFDFDEAKFKDKGCPCEKLDKKECKAVGILQFLLPEVIGSINSYQITTSSINSIKDVNSGIKVIRNLANRISMIPIELIRELTETQYIENGKPHKSKHFTMKLKLPFSLAELQRKAQIPAHEIFLLPEPDENQDEDIFPVNGHAPKDEKVEVIESESNEIPVPDIADMASGPVDAEKEAYKTITVILSNGKKKKISKYDALKLFRNIKKEIGKESYYQVLGVHGYEKSNQVKEKNIPEVYADMIRAYHELVEDGKIDNNQELFEGE